MVQRRSPLLAMLGLVLGCSSETLPTDEELDATAPAHPAPVADGGLAGEPLEAFAFHPASYDPMAHEVLATDRWTDLPHWRDGALHVHLDRSRMVRIEDGRTSEAGPEGRRCRGVDHDGWRPCLKEADDRTLRLTRVRGDDREVLLHVATEDAPGLANDWAVSPTGAIYFSNRCGEHDRCSSAPEGAHGGVYRWADDRLTEVHAGVPNPNGVAVSPDGAWLYVAAAAYQDRSEAHIHRFALAGAGMLGEPEPFAEVRTPDGMAVAPDGTVWTAANDSSVVAHEPDGTLLGRLRAKGRITNLTFGGPAGHTLFVTTDREGVFGFHPREEEGS